MKIPRFQLPENTILITNWAFSILLTIITTFTITNIHTIHNQKPPINTIPDIQLCTPTKQLP